MFKNLSLAVVLTMAFAVSGASSTVAETGDRQLAMSHGKMGDAKTIIERRTAMRCISTGLKALKKGKGDAKESAALVMKNASTVGDDFEKLFPKGSHMGETRATKEIWGDWDKFKKFAQDLKESGANLAKTASAGGDIKAAIKDMSGSCKGCHKAFRKKGKPKPKVKCNM